MIKIDTDEFEQVKQILSNGENIFITGGGGVGKSYLLNKLREHYKKLLILTSTTGISAINIGGQTLHSWAGIGLAEKPVDDVVKKINRKPTLKKQLCSCRMLAIDEISMLDDYTMEYVDEVLQQVRENSKPFGGIQLILVGDFFQLPPVKMRDNDSGRDFCFNCETWKTLNLTTLLLKKVKRQSEEEFINALNNVRIDKTSNDDLKVFYDRDYPASYEPDKDILQIFGTNKDADAYNEKCFNELDTRTYNFSSKDLMFQYSVFEDSDAYETIKLTDEAIENLSFSDKKCLENFSKDCKAPKELVLKEGCRVMLLKNIDLAKGLVNGSCGTIKNLTSASIDVLFDNGQRLNLEPEEFDYIQDGKTKIKRVQYPLRLAYGITIHKSQGDYYDNLSYCFCSDLINEISNWKVKPDYWFSGHTHMSDIEEIEGIKFYSNQYGYYFEDEEFTHYNKDLVIEVN